jgi:hypothetical protein
MYTSRRVRQREVSEELLLLKLVSSLAAYSW